MVDGLFFLDVINESILNRVNISTSFLQLQLRGKYDRWTQSTIFVSIKVYISNDANGKSFYICNEIFYIRTMYDFVEAFGRCSSM